MDAVDTLNAAIATRQAQLTTESALAVDTITARIYFGDAFRFFNADQTASLLTLADNELGAEFSTRVRAPGLTVGSFIGIGTTTRQRLTSSVLSYVVLGSESAIST